MRNKANEIEQGWGFPNGAKKAHFFHGKKGRSLHLSFCEKWLFGGAIYDSNHQSPSNCKKCVKRHAAHIGRKKETTREMQMRLDALKGQSK